MNLNIFIVYLAKALLLFLQLFTLIVLGFSEYTQLAVLIGTGELLSSFITLGVHSAVLRTKCNNIILQHMRVNVITLSLSFVAISYFYITNNQYICIIILLAISSSITKLTRAYVISQGLVSQLTISYLFQILVTISLLIASNIESAQDVARIIIAAQFLSTFQIVYHCLKGFTAGIGETDRIFVRQNIRSFFIRDIASLSSGHLARSLLYFLGLTEAAGLYSICYQVHAYSLQLLVPFNQIIRPTLRNHYSENNLTVFSNLKKRWQKYYALIGISVVLSLAMILSYSGEYLSLYADIPSDIHLYMNLLLVGTFVCFAMDLNNVWTMLIFKNSDFLIKYMVVVYAALVLLCQLIAYIFLGDIGFIVGYSFSLILVNVSNLIIYRYSLVSREERLSV